MSEVSKAKVAAQVPKPRNKKKRLKLVPATEYGVTKKKSGQEKKAFQNIRLIIYQKLQVLY